MKFSKMNLIKKYIKLNLSYPRYRVIFKQLKKNKGTRAIIIGSPIHSNLGDHLIAEKCVEYVSYVGYDHIIEIPEFVYEIYSKKISLQQSDSIFVVGGGWLGNLYEDQLVVEDILKKYFRNNITILPQTIAFFEDAQFSSLEKFNKFVEKCESLIVCLRDKKSYDFVCRNVHINLENVYLLPDMALLHLVNVKTHTKKYDTVMLSMRDDVEKNDTIPNIEQLVSSFPEKDVNFKYVSTVLNKKYIPFNKRMIYIENIIDTYRKSDLVITDRLHSMIFALSAGTKCLAFDNKTKKVLGVYKTWLENMPGIVVIENGKVNIKESINDLMNNDGPKQINFIDKYDILTCKLRSVKNGK